MAGEGPKSQGISGRESKAGEHLLVILFLVVNLQTQQAGLANGAWLEPTGWRIDLGARWPARTAKEYGNFKWTGRLPPPEHVKVLAGQRVCEVSLGARALHSALPTARVYDVSLTRIWSAFNVLKVREQNKTGRWIKYTRWWEGRGRVWKGGRPGSFMCS